LYDADTGLLRFGARDYDPSVGRWASKDPIGFDGGQNFYVYCGDDPVNNVDLTGLRKYSGREVEVILLKYRQQLDKSQGLVDRYLTMLERHRGCGPDDYWCKDRADKEKDGPDTYDVRGHILNAAQFGNFIAGYAAGYAIDPLAHAAVRAAGSIYGIIGLRDGDAKPEWSQLLFLGDNFDSVMHIDAGAFEGIRDKLKKWKR
jgi:RHS repeat-associated protein